MSFLVSPNEVDLLKLLGDDGFAYNLPFDVGMFTETGQVAVERKAFPSDFVASVRDGRWAKEAAAMREWAPYRIGILEGEPRYDAEDHLIIGNRTSQWTKKGIRNMIRSVKWVEGLDIEWTYDMNDTVECLHEIQGWFDETNHWSLRTRPTVKGSWYTPIYEERFIHWLQGCGKGVSIGRARKLAEYFHTPFEIFNASIEDLQACPGIGEGIATGLYNFLRGVKL